MTPRELLEAFETLADAPDGVKRLRELVLHLAVRGKLVPQDPNDRPARAMLERVAESNNRSWPVKKRESTRPASDAVPYPLPKGWEWARLAEIADYNGRPNIEAGDIAADCWILDLEDIEKTTSRLLARATFRDRNSVSTKSTFERGDVLYGKLRPYLDKVLVADRSGACTTEIVPIVPHPETSAEWLRWLLKRPDFLAYVNRVSYGVKMPRLGTQDAVDSLHPLPPLAEQHRIVARVDELMGLLDRLEAARADRNEVRSAARDAALADLREAEGPEAFEFAWARISGQMGTLFTTPEDVAPLRQAILHLGIRGRLVAQDSTDESPDNLLLGIAAAKALDGSERASAGRSIWQPIRENELPATLPSSWIWCRLGQISLSISDGDHLPPPQVPEGIPFLTIGNVSGGHLDFESTRHVSPEYFSKIGPTRTPGAGDILYTVVGASFGRPVRVETSMPFCVQRHIAIIKLTSHISQAYLYYFLRSPFAYTQATRAATGSAQPTIPLRPLRQFIVPLPPLAEQCRIAAKIDALMALCDALELRLAAIRDLQAQFAAAAVHHLDV